MTNCYEVYLKTRSFGRSLVICTTTAKDYALLIHKRVGDMLERLANYFYLKDRHKEKTLPMEEIVFCVSSIDYLFEKADASKEALCVNSKENFVRTYVAYRRGVHIREIKILDDTKDNIDEVHMLNILEGGKQ